MATVRIRTAQEKSPLPDPAGLHDIPSITRMEFSFTSHGQDTGTFVLKGNLIGEADGINITESFMEQIDHGIRHFILDLSSLQHINSSGLGVFITLLTKARKVGGEVALAGPSTYISNLLMITKLNTIFHIHDNVETALASFSG